MRVRFAARLSVSRCSAIGPVAVVELMTVRGGARRGPAPKGGAIVVQTATHIRYVHPVRGAKTAVSTTLTFGKNAARQLWRCAIRQVTFRYLFDRAARRVAA